ncbi:hypothetical protein HOLleu_40665 [Holothuria leucospilota]|uniref:Uncharacterized protein n=1 Tax=Holothuria leucospilota TaxID=206669 RepID=A0A9Q0YGD2_HOLLE|nr:hypothetical protein HOLleu_40665 [Holothuria leucospilota]
MDSFQTEIQNVEKFLRTGEYPADFTANQKRVLRRRAKSFKFRPGGEQLAFKDGRKLLYRSEDQQTVIQGMHEGAAEFILVETRLWQKLPRDITGQA